MWIAILLTLYAGSVVLAYGMALHRLRASFPHRLDEWGDPALASFVALGGPLPILRLLAIGESPIRLMLDPRPRRRGQAEEATLSLRVPRSDGSITVPVLRPFSIGIPPEALTQGRLTLPGTEAQSATATGSERIRFLGGGEISSPPRDPIADALHIERHTYRATLRTAAHHYDRIHTLRLAAKGHITVEMIEREANQEVRSAMLERFGFQRYMEAVGAEVVAADEYGELLEYDTPWAFLAHRLRAVRVTNSTPEPDGTYRTYILRVPPDTPTPRAGLAWTFGLDRAEDYSPDLMT